MATSVLVEEFQIFLPDQVADPADNTWEEIRWYFEDYAQRDMFTFSRAQSAERSLKSYGLSLALAIYNSVLRLNVSKIQACWSWSSMKPNLHLDRPEFIGKFWKMSRSGRMSDD